MVIAEALASGSIGNRRGRPRQTHLRRAVSAAYYAMFHTLAAVIADALAGAGPGSRTREVWVRAYRSLEHGTARNQFMHTQSMAGFRPEIRHFGQTFIRMQSQRQSADYNPAATFQRLQVMLLISATAEAISRLNGAARRDLRALALYVLLRPRRE